MSVLLTCLLFCAVAGSIQPCAINYQNYYPDGVNSVPTGETALIIQKHMGFYGDCYTNSNAASAYDGLKNSSIFYFTGHGGPGYLKFPDNTLIIANSSYGRDAVLSNTGEGDLNMLKLVVLNGCNTANDDPDIGSLPDEFLRLGADTVLCFRTPIGNDESNYWSDRFWSYMDKGYTAGDAAYCARNDVFFNFGRFGGMDSYEICGDTLLRLT